LLNNARRLGAQVREQVKVQNVDLSSPSSVTVESVDADCNEYVHQADAIHDQLSSVPDGVNAKMVESYRQVTGADRFVHRMIRLFYNPHAVTWAEVGSERAIHRAHESAMAAGHFMLSGDFVENHEQYSKFFELLEDPKTFSRYKTLVLDRAEFQQLSCKTPWAVAFGRRLDRFTPETAAAELVPAEATSRVSLTQTT
jgi:hypothetical protein